MQHQFGFLPHQIYFSSFSLTMDQYIGLRWMWKQYLEFSTGCIFKLLEFIKLFFILFYFFWGNKDILFFYFFKVLIHTF